MSDGTRAEAFFAIAEESLAGAISEHANGRHRNCANRAYYATFQAAIAELLRIGVGPSGRDRQWLHDTAKARFAAQLISLRKLYPAAFSDVLEHGAPLRVKADCTTDTVSATEARRALRRSQEFVQAIRRQGGNDL